MHKYTMKDVLGFIETEKEAKERASERVRRLGRCKSPKSIALAVLLNSCSRSQPCGSAACPVCFRKYREGMITRCLDAIETNSKGKIATIVYYQGVLTDRELYELDPQKLRNRLYGQLRRSGIEGPVIGHLEFDYDRESRCWMPHFHLLMWSEVESEKRLRVAIKKCSVCFDPDRPSRPLKVQPIKDPLSQVSYIFKSYNGEIQTYWWKGKRRTRKVGLKSHRLALSLRTFDRIGFRGLLFRYGIPRRDHPLSDILSTLKSSKPQR